MASPQKENGYTPIANEILDAISKARINGTQASILFQIWRYTYGFNRTSHILSASFLSKGTGINKVRLSQELKKLIDNKIVTVITRSCPREIAFNKNYNEWLNYDHSADPITISENVYSTISESANTTNNTISESANTIVSENIYSTISESANQEIQYKKQNKNNGASDSFFEQIWQLYPNKKGKAQVCTKSKKELQRLGIDVVKTCIDRYVADKPEWKQYQNGSTFFNKGYIDYLDENYIEQSVSEVKRSESQRQQLTKQQLEALSQF